MALKDFGRLGKLLSAILDLFMFSTKGLLLAGNIAFDIKEQRHPNLPYKWSKPVKDIYRIKKTILKMYFLTGYLSSQD